MPNSTYSANDINAIYQAVQFRDGPKETLDAYVALLNMSAMTLAQVQQAVKADSFTQDYVNPVIRLYQAAFNRVPESAGENFWVDGQAAGSISLQDAANNFANSSEFQGIYGVNASAPINAAVLTAFYQNILGRAPDSAGYTYWLNSGQNVGQVLHYFAQSTEFKNSSAEFIGNFQTAQINHTVPDETVPLTSFTTVTPNPDPSPEPDPTTDPDPNPGPPADSTAPTLSSSNPLDNATAVAVGSNIVLTFSENVQAGTGTIIVSDGSDTRNISVTDSSQVTISGTTVTINPAFDLLPGSTYNVQMAAGVVVDAAGNAFAGISSPTTLDFTTLIPDTTAPTISAFSVASDSTLSVTSSESGTAQLYDGVMAIGSVTTLLAAAPQAFTVAQQNSVTTAALKVFDDALNAITDSTDVILGTWAGDALTGTADSDFIFGFDGTDILDGRLGADKLIGGSGVDQFKFSTTSGVTSDSNSNGYDSIIDFTLTDYIRANLNAVTQFDGSSSSYVITNQSTNENLLILSVRGNGSGSDADALVIGIGSYNPTSAASQVSYDIIGTSGADSLTGGDIGDYLTGGAGIDQLYGGNGTDALIIAAASDDAIGELYDGGNGADDYLYISGITVVDLRDDTVTNIETLNMSGSSDAQSLTLLASQLSGFTLSVSANSSDSMTVYNMTGGAMSASGGTDTFVWNDTDNGMNRISGFNRYVDKLRFDFVLNQGSNGAAVTTVDATNDLSASSLLYTGFGVSSFAQAGKAAYALYLGIGSFDATASGILNTTNGIDFAIATEANILANVEAALENTSDGGGVGIVSRVNGSGVTNGAAGTDIVFLLDDGGGDTAVIRYQEGGSAEADYAGELTLLAVITGNTGGDFNPAWNSNIYALFA